MERPRSCELKAASESNRTMSCHRLLQSSCNSHLQYISTRGRSCTQAARNAWWEGMRPESKRRHKSWPAQTQARERAQETARNIQAECTTTTAVGTPEDCTRGGRKKTHPALSSGTRTHVPPNAKNMHSKTAYIPASNPPLYKNISNSIKTTCMLARGGTIPLNNCAYREPVGSKKSVHMCAVGVWGTCRDAQSMLPNLGNPELCGMDKGVAEQHAITNTEYRRGRCPRPQPITATSVKPPTNPAVDRQTPMRTGHNTHRTG